MARCRTGQVRVGWGSQWGWDRSGGGGILGGTRGEGGRGVGKVGMDRYRTGQVRVGWGNQESWDGTEGWGGVCVGGGGGGENTWGYKGRGRQRGWEGRYG